MLVVVQFLCCGWSNGFVFVNPLPQTMKSNDAEGPFWLFCLCLKGPTLVIMSAISTTSLMLIWAYLPASTLQDLGMKSSSRAAALSSRATSLPWKSGSEYSCTWNKHANRTVSDPARTDEQDSWGKMGWAGFLESLEWRVDTLNLVVPIRVSYRTDRFCFKNFNFTWKMTFT